MTDQSRDEKIDFVVNSLASAALNQAHVTNEVIEQIQALLAVLRLLVSFTMARHNLSGELLYQEADPVLTTPNAKDTARRLLGVYPAPAARPTFRVIEGGKGPCAAGDGEHGA